MSRAASRPAVPLAWSVARLPPTCCGCPMSTWPMKEGNASALFDFVNSCESGSVVLARVALLAFLALEIDFRIALATGLVRRRAVLRHKALARGPGMDQRAIDAEMIGGEQLGFFRLLHHASEQGLDRM